MESCSIKSTKTNRHFAPRDELAPHYHLAVIKVLWGAGVHCNQIQTRAVALNLEYEDWEVL